MLLKIDLNARFSFYHFFGKISKNKFKLNICYFRLIYVVEVTYVINIKQQQKFKIGVINPAARIKNL